MGVVRVGKRGSERREEREVRWVKVVWRGVGGGVGGGGWGGDRQKRRGGGCVWVGGGGGVGEWALKPTQTSHRLFSYCNSPYRVKFKFIDQTPWDITFILGFFLIQNTQNPLFIHVLYVYDIYKEIFCLQLNGVQ